MRIRYPTRFITSITQIYLVLHSPKTIAQNLRKISSTRFIYHSTPKSCPSLSTMAGESESFSTAVDENAKFGFERSEMHQSKLAGSVHPYDRHVFLCYKSHESWPTHVENSDADPLPKLLASALKARQNDMNLKTRLTICEAGDDVNLSDGDVLIFPEMIVYRGLVESEVDIFVEEVLVNGKASVSGVKEELTGSYVFVCAHNNRDRRCGVCGPILIEKFKEEIASKDLNNQVSVIACSHVGGHKYAGNVIIFSTDSDGKIGGNWYGYVTPGDVHELLDKQIGQGEVIERIWRGQMGANVTEVEKVEEPKLTNGTVSNEKQPEEIIVTEEKSASNGGCCQGANGISCCRDENVEKKPVKKGLLSCYVGKWEQRHTLTTVAVVGALATVAVAYGVFRKAR